MALSTQQSSTLGGIKESDAPDLDGLAKIARSGNDFLLRDKAASSLRGLIEEDGALATSARIEAIAAVVKDFPNRNNIYYFSVLGKHGEGNPLVIEALSAACKNPEFDSHITNNAVTALIKVGPREALPVLQELIRESSAEKVKGIAYGIYNAPRDLLWHLQPLGKSLAEAYARLGVGSITDLALPALGMSLENTTVPERAATPVFKISTQGSGAQGTIIDQYGNALAEGSYGEVAVYILDREGNGIVEATGSGASDYFSLDKGGIRKLEQKPAIIADLPEDARHTIPSQGELLRSLQGNAADFVSYLSARRIEFTIDPLKRGVVAHCSAEDCFSRHGFGDIRSAFDQATYYGFSVIFNPK